MIKGLKRKNKYITVKASESKPSIPEGMWTMCPSCSRIIYSQDLKDNNHECPKCSYAFRLNARERVELISDEGSFEEMFSDIVTNDPLHFDGYREKLMALEEKTGENESVITGISLINGIRVGLAVMNPDFLMGSLGYATGERLTLLIELCIQRRLPLIIFCASGGARMQEGIVSLMQMAKVSQAVKKHSDAGLLYISVITNPTTGGVTASFAMQGDIIMAEPKATLGFAGRRVIENTIRERLPDDYQTTESALENGFVDLIVPRAHMKDSISELLVLHGYNKESMEGHDFDSSDLKASHDSTEKNPSDTDCKYIFNRVENMKELTEDEAWRVVETARHKDRPGADLYISEIFPNSVELHGDKAIGDDKAITIHISTLNNIPVTVIGLGKGINTIENIKKNFAMASPHGYRKALRAVEQAEKFHRPVIFLVDTPGAYCGVEAENKGQGYMIARCLYEFSNRRIPMITVITGEGGSGGALALAFSDRVYMMENTIYSILSPEGFASILWKDADRKKEASKKMRIGSKDLLAMGIIDGIILEREGAHINPFAMVRELKGALEYTVDLLKDINIDDLLVRRYDRFRAMGSL